MSSGSVFLIPHRLSIWSYCCFPQSETLPSHFLLLQINRTGILGCADVCRGAIVFSNSNLYMSLPAPYTRPRHRMQLPVPVWLPRRFLHHHQEWLRTSPYPSATSRRYGTHPPAMELDLDFVQNACCENDWNKTEAYGVFASSWVKHRWISCVLWFGSMN